MHLSQDTTERLAPIAFAAGVVVAGAAALILQAEPELKPAQVAEKLLKATVSDKISGEKSGSPDRLLQVK